MIIIHPNRDSLERAAGLTHERKKVAADSDHFVAEIAYHCRQSAYMYSIIEGQPLVSITRNARRQNQMC